MLSRRSVTLCAVSFLGATACSEPDAPAETRVVDAGADAPGVTDDAAGCTHARPGPALLDQRYSMPAFALADGRVLLVGGHFNERNDEPLNTCEIVDLEKGSSTLTGTFNVPRTTSGPGGTTQLADGRILTASPFVGSNEAPIPAEIWDPSTEAWTVTGAQTGVGGGPAVTLPDGRVLVAGGIDWNTDTPMATTEIWDPATGLWEPTGDMTSARTGHALVVVDGRAMAIGGFDVYPGGEALGSTERFDPDSGTWSTAASLTFPRGVQRVAVLADGRLLSAGGTTTSGGNQPTSADAELYEPGGDRWTPVAALNTARAGHVLVPLASGRILAIAGATGAWSRDTPTVEVFSPERATWSEAAPLGRARRLHSAVLLPTGEVAVMGGDGAEYDSEIYMPCPG